MHHKESAERLGHQILKARQSRKLSLRQLSTLSGIPRTTIERIEKGDIDRPRPDVLTALARELGLPLSDLYAAARYSAPHDLPSFAPYLRVRYRDFSRKAIEELTSYFETLAQREGVRLEGPTNREDEAR